MGAIGAFEFTPQPFNGRDPGSLPLPDDKVDADQPA